MRRSKLYYALIFPLLGFIAFPAKSQDRGGSDPYARAFADSVLTYERYIDLVEEYHPVSVLADLEVDLARADLRRSRGGFDPALYGDYATKEFRESRYYEYLDAGVEIPTWAGLSFRGGFQNSNGAFINPDKRIPGPGQLSAGLSAQLGAGLLMDERRAALRQAQIGLEQGQLDRVILRNRLYVEATTAYYRWAFAEAALRIAEEALELANFRYGAVRENFRYGDVPAIDTVEAYTQVLNRLNLWKAAQSDWVEALNTAEVFLWDEEGRAREIPPGIRPNALEPDPAIAEGLPMIIDADHPELRRLRTVTDFLDIDRRLAAEFLRPRAELRYNFLSENVMMNSDEQIFSNAGFFDNNYTFGARVFFPLFMREARGRVGMAKVKMRMVDQDYYNLDASLSADLDAALVRLQNLREQIDYTGQNVEYLGRLLEGERALFENGESSLFLINARETQLVDGQNIYVNLLARARILYAEIRNIAGQGF